MWRVASHCILKRAKVRQTGLTEKFKLGKRLIAIDWPHYRLGSNANSLHLMTLES